MSKTKIALSDKELEMVNDQEWILTKQRVIQQVYYLLESVVEDIDLVILPTWTALTNQPTSPPRIFKGENYLGLPYVTLDYPKLFNSEYTLTVRTMFWWGNFFSVTLHGGSNYTDHLVNKLKEHGFSNLGLYICIHENQWHHSFEPDNYVLVQDVSTQQINDIRKRDFIKLAYKVSLTEFNEARTLLSKNYRMLAEIMA